MYEENENNDFSRVNPEEHKEEIETVNFTMIDPEPAGAGEGNVKQNGEETGAGEPYVSQQPVNQQPISHQTQQPESPHSESPHPVSQQPSQAGSVYQENIYGNGTQQSPVYGAASAQNTGYQNYQGQGVKSGHGPNGYGAPQGEPQYEQRAGQIPHYQEPRYREQQYQQDGPPYRNIPEEPKRRKKSGFAKKAAALVGAALVFGVVSGSVMVGINWVAGSYNQNRNVEVSKAETLPSAAQNGDSGQTGGTAGAVVSGMDVSAIVDKSMPSVVAITSKVIYESQTWFGLMQQEGTGSGSGIIVGQNDNELLIVTNNHVVQGAEELKVTFINDIAVDAAIKGGDSDTDLAVIAVQLKDIPADTLSQITIANMGNSDNLKVGQGVVAIGNALGYGQSVTVGYISALSREVKTDDGLSRDLLQTDAAINPGNSGGALLNMQGELIGINSAKYSSTDVEGMGYAIPISKAQDIINELMTKKTRTQVAEGSEGYLGIQCKNIDANTSQQLGMPQGVFIYKIVEGGAASKSELREKDIITKFDGQSVRSYEELTSMLKYYEAGSTITVTVQSVENGAYVERQVDITLDKRPAQEVQTPQR